MNNTFSHAVRDIAIGRTLFMGTLKECKQYKRTYWNQYAVIRALTIGASA